MRVPERSFDPVARGSGFALPRFGQTYFVHASDIAALHIRVGVAARRRRLFHPNGVLAEGILERIAPPDEGLPMNSCDVISRVSKGIGLPGALPDIASLAWRIPPTPDLRSCTPWDVLLASTVANSRIVLAPMRSWSSFNFLQPYAVSLPRRRVVGARPADHEDRRTGFVVGPDQESNRQRGTRFRY